MSFADYTSLKTAVATDWLHRGDLTSQAGDFISLFESEFNASVQVRQMEAQTTITSTTGYLVHPSDWQCWKEIRGTISGIPYSMEPVTDEVALARSAGNTGTAKMFKVKGAVTYLYPASNGDAFPTTYYQKINLVGAGSGTNWLLTAYPGAYLYGSLLQATAFLFDDARIPLWQTAYAKIIDRIQDDSRRSEYSGQSLRIQHDIKIA